MATTPNTYADNFAEVVNTQISVLNATKEALDTAIEVITAQNDILVEPSTISPTKSLVQAVLATLQSYSQSVGGEAIRYNLTTQS